MTPSNSLLVQQATCFLSASAVSGPMASWNFPAHTGRWRGRTRCRPPHAGRAHPPAHADDGDVGGTAADVHDHAAVRLADGQPRAQRGGPPARPPEMTWRAPAAMTDSTTASASTPVMAAGTQTATRGLRMRERQTSLTKRTISSLVMRWSWMTPSLSGRTRSIYAGARPTMRSASSPTATMVSLRVSTAPMAGWWKMTPCFSVAMMMEVVPGRCRCPVVSCVFLRSDALLPGQFFHCRDGGGCDVRRAGLQKRQRTGRSRSPGGDDIIDKQHPLAAEVRAGPAGVGTSGVAHASGTAQPFWAAPRCVRSARTTGTPARRPNAGPAAAAGRACPARPGAAAPGRCSGTRDARWQRRMRAPPGRFAGSAPQMRTAMRSASSRAYQGRAPRLHSRIARRTAPV